MENDSYEPNLESPHLFFWIARPQRSIGVAKQDECRPVVRVGVGSVVAAGGSGFCWRGWLQRTDRAAQLAAGSGEL